VVHSYVAPASNSRFKFLLAWQQILTHGLQGRRPRLAGPRGVGFLGEGIGKGMFPFLPSGSWERCKLPKWGAGQSKALVIWQLRTIQGLRKRILCVVFYQIFCSLKFLGKTYFALDIDYYRPIPELSGKSWIVGMPKAVVCSLDSVFRCY